MFGEFVSASGFEQVLQLIKPSVSEQDLHKLSKKESTEVRI